MCADAFEKNGIVALMFYKLKDDTQIITPAASPRASQFAFQLMCFKLWMKSILCQ